ncbi:MAG: sugar transferase [Bacteroidia bacterium]
MHNPYLQELQIPDVKIRDLRKYNHLNDSIIGEVGNTAFDFISEHVDTDDEKTLVTVANSMFNIDSLSDNYFKAIVNLKRINDIHKINEYLECVNEKLPAKGILIGSVETKTARKNRILRKYPVVLGHIYYAFDFILKRIFPKLPVTRKIYFKITAGRNRVLSKTETMGRLYCCGFHVIEEKLIGNRLYFVAKKVKEPSYDDENSYGPIYRMKRYGKDGKIITVYKIRTMHAFAEYLQEYVYQKNSLKEGGKFKNDFRVSTIGKFFRKYWLDELPMLINLLKGDVKLVGVRPLSKQYLSLYTEELIQKRFKHKPGLIPPFYADLPKTLEEIMASEMRYFEQYEKAPFRTDVKYFLKICFNIVFRNARSN